MIINFFLDLYGGGIIIGVTKEGVQTEAGAIIRTYGTYIIIASIASCTSE